MRTYKVILISIGVFFFCSMLNVGEAQTKWPTYRNARFNYSISYPADVLLPQGESDNGDGQKFTSRDQRAELLVYGSHNALNQSLRQMFDAETQSGPEHGDRRLTYRVLKDNWFVVSGIKSGKIFYQRRFSQTESSRLSELNTTRVRSKPLIRSPPNSPAPSKADVTPGVRVHITGLTETPVRFAR